MYIPNFQTSATNIPILNKIQLDDIGENIVKDFCPDAIDQPQAIDVDRLLTNYLGVNLEYTNLTNSGIYLGITFFADCNAFPVYDQNTDKPIYIPVKAGTVLIDSSLLRTNQEHRYSFTVAHEAAHIILHSGYFLKREQNAKNYIQCNKNSIGANTNKRTDNDWLEWQANQLASAILMPRKAVCRVVRRAERKYISVNAGTEAVISTFNVSSSAAFYRIDQLKSLGYI